MLRFFDETAVTGRAKILSRSRAPPGVRAESAVLHAALCLMLAVLPQPSLALSNYGGQLLATGSGSIEDSGSVDDTVKLWSAASESVRLTPLSFAMSIIDWSMPLT